MSSAEMGLVGQGTEVTAKPRRRQFTAEFKRKVLAEADACSKVGEIGALLRREGLYSSHLVEWRRARDSGALAGRRGEFVLCTKVGYGVEGEAGVEQRHLRGRERPLRRLELAGLGARVARAVQEERRRAQLTEAPLVEVRLAGPAGRDDGAPVPLRLPEVEVEERADQREVGQRQAFALAPGPRPELALAER